jgi:hypothetical protein
MCIGCGSIEAPQTCIGICEHHKVEFVHAAEHRATLAALGRARDERRSLEALVRRMACVTPHDDRCAASLKVFREEARRLLTTLRSPFDPNGLRVE